MIHVNYTFKGLGALIFMQVFIKELSNIHYLH